MNYYKLRAYTYPFQKNDLEAEHYFIEKNITFEDVLALYYFDRNLRRIILSVIEPIELAFKARVASECMQDHGPFFLNEENLFHGYSFLKELEKAYQKSKETFIQHHQKKYDDDPLPPAWVLIEIITISTVSKIYSQLKNTIPTKDRIAKNFALTTYELTSIIKTLCITRNKCAHHARIWNKEHRVFIPHSWDGVLYPKEIDGRKVGGIYTILSAISHLLRQLPEPELADSLVLQVEELIQSPIINKYPQTQLYKMGFPADWNTANPLWHKSRS